MAIKYEEAREFVRNNGTVTAYSATGKASPLRDGEPDIVAIVELNADVFEFKGEKYSRVQFERLIREAKK